MLLALVFVSSKPLRTLPHHPSSGVGVCLCGKLGDCEAQRAGIVKGEKLIIGVGTG